MPIKMIVTDLDRTLLRSDKSISDYTAGILNRCHEKGIIIVFATARPKRTVKHFFASIEADAVIYHNGAVTYVGDKLLHKCGIPSNIKDDILLAISEDHPETKLSVEIDDCFYANFDVSVVWNYANAIQTNFNDLPDIPADKIIIGISSMDEVQLFSKYLPNEYYMEMSEGHLGLIMNKGATKHASVKVIASYFHCNLNEIAAFGDDYNDIGMLKECGIGVAMGNALDDVKAIADCICTTNDQDGVAHWIEENILDSIPNDFV